MANKMTREELIKASKNMDTAELVEKLNEDAANFIEQLPKANLNDLWTLDDWDKQVKTHPFFMTKLPAEGEEMPPLVEALQSLKYDPNENTPEELARSYKEDGNENFKKKKYQWAVDSYTEGLKSKCTNQELLLQLHTNRAAAHYHIGNYEKSLKDASAAKSINKNHFKALERGALCCFKLNRLSECISWCEEGMHISPESKSLKDLKDKAIEKKKSDDRNRRKAQAINAKHMKELKRIKEIIAEREIKLSGEKLHLDHIETVAPEAVNSKVYLDQHSKLIWPVMMLYPEYGTSDYIQEFHEDSVFLEHLKEMFEGDSPTWDEDKKYIPEKLQVYFIEGNNIIPVKSTSTLKKTLSDKRYVVYNGTPCFFVTVAGSNFDKEFRKMYTLVK